MNAMRSAGRVVDGIELVLFPGPQTLAYLGVTDPDDVAWMEPKLTPHPYKCFEQPLRLTNEAELWQIPQTHIVCTTPRPYRDPARMESARAAGRLREIDTGHDLMITEPKAVADLLLGLLTA
jgi:hypothetical protein